MLPTFCIYGDSVMSNHLIVNKHQHEDIKLYNINFILIPESFVEQVIRLENEIRAQTSVQYCIFIKFTTRNATR